MNEYFHLLFVFIAHLLCTT